MNRFKASKFRHTEARLPRREAWIGGIRAGSVASCGNHVKASCRWIAFNAEAPGVLGIVPLECEDRGKRTVSQLCCHPDVVTDFDFSPFDQFLLATGSADKTVKVWRLPESGQDMPSDAGLTLGPGGDPVDVLQFHPTADGVLASGAGKRVTVWDVGQQQPLTALASHGARLHSLAWQRDGRLLGTSCKDKKLRIFDPRASPAASQRFPVAWELWLLAAAVPHCGKDWKPSGGEGCSGEPGETAAAGSAAPQLLLLPVCTWPQAQEADGPGAHAQAQP